MLLPVHWDIYGQCQAPSHCIRKFTSPRLTVSKVRGEFSSTLTNLNKLNKWLCLINIPISVTHAPASRIDTLLFP